VKDASLLQMQNPNMEDKIENIVSCAIDRVNELLPAGQPLQKERPTALLGRSGRLDSMGFVNLAVALEEELEKQLGMAVSLADELMMDGRGLGTVGELHELIARIIKSRRSTDSMTNVDPPRTSVVEAPDVEGQLNAVE
jgi:acyl carrier protein